VVGLMEVYDMAPTLTLAVPPLLLLLPPPLQLQPCSRVVSVPTCTVSLSSKQRTIVAPLLPPPLQAIPSFSWVLIVLLMHVIPKRPTVVSVGSRGGDGIGEENE